MDRCSSRGISIVLAMTLVVSLVGVTGMGMLSQAFAVESDDLLTTEVPGFAFDGEGDASQGKPSYDPFAEPREHYVYEYVYGVFSDEYAVAANKETPEWGDGFARWGTLISASEGEVLEEGMLVRTPFTGTPYSVSEKGARYVSFQKDGKYGVLDYPNKRVVIDPVYDSEGNSSPDKERWGFISLGEQSSDGDYPNARAVVRSINGVELLSVSLSQYKEKGYVSCRTTENGKTEWQISWSTIQGDTERLVYAGRAEAPGFSLISEEGASSSTNSTSDGRTVIFRMKDGKIVFAAADHDGNMGEEKILATDNTNLSDCTTVSNIIEVRGSNGYDYQYFTLDGSLLQSVNGKKLYGLGDYVSYARTSFDEQQRVQVFLDTSDECREAKEIPSIQTSLSSFGSNVSFECLTLDNKIQRYDADLKLIREFEPSIDLVEELQAGRKVNWMITDFGGDAWSFEVSVSIRTESYSYEVIEREAVVFVGSDRRTSDQLGFDSPHMVGIGTLDDLMYLASGGESAQLRLFDRSFRLVNSIELAPYVPDGVSLSHAGVFRDGSCEGMNAVRIGLSFNTQLGSAVPSTRDLYLDGRYGMTDYEYLSRVHTQTSYVFAAKKGGKWGFVDANLNPRSDFVFDACPYYLYNFSEGPGGRFVVEENGKHRLLDENLDDVLGAIFDSIDVIGEGFCLVKNDGNLSIYDDRSQKIDLHGYMPALHNWHSHLRGVRSLQDGTKMIYVRNAQGRIGAIDTAGNIVIPFEFEDYADCAGPGISPSFIMLRDSDGWFFLPVDELCPSHLEKDECEALGHLYEEAVYAPTCTTNGYSQYVCKRCGSSYEDESSIVPMLGHDFIVVANATAPTCTEQGKGAEYECARCGERKKDADTPSYGGHEYSEWVNIVFPTCTTSGLREHTCERCGLTEQSEWGPYGHVWSYPTWDWSDDLQAATATLRCERGCGEVITLDAVMSYEEVEGGIRHSACVTVSGRDYKDGRLALDWVDSNGVSRSLLVRGEPVADGFTVIPKDLVLPSSEGPVLIDVTPVNEGGIFDALVAKIGSGWPAGTFDVRLSVDGDELHDGFGTIAFAFPVGKESAGKKATVYHCHKNDRGNITAHDTVVSEDGYVVLGEVTDLSTFALSLYGEGNTAIDTGTGISSLILKQVSDPATASSGSSSVGQRSALVRTYDDASSLLLICAFGTAILCFALGIVTMRGRRASSKRR